MNTILCFGDSNTYGLNPRGGRFHRNVRWPGIVRELLGQEYEIIEEGLPGRTTVWEDPVENVMSGKAYLPPCLRSHAPLELVVLMLGTNDLKARYAVSAADIALSVLSLVQLVRSTLPGDGERTSPQVLVLVPPPIREAGLSASIFAGGEAKSRRLGEAFNKLKPYTDASILDLAAVITTSEIDGLHFDAEEHRKLGETVAREIKAMLE
ncbi:lysophospholipase L1-like esterase [Paenibacillus sp. BK033]|uniref:SGNH/GDSL hydrolase family protein n=1 Tax=Paenibacillus sp. BK033 TaxID=2512133 RepID=UPI0010499722|nr:SGNH/GDSL hydrolase family protein [Paenibacillus sp. BK033]TCM90689.1 lysophospholipase L1-like esterase [Paenibacillus sp. BK033]